MAEDNEYREGGVEDHLEAEVAVRQSLSSRAQAALALGVSAVVLLAFSPVLGNGFVGWDDIPTIVSNAHLRELSLDNLPWMFATRHMGHYQPLTWVSLALDFQIWELDPMGFHLTNLLFHVANALLFFLLLQRIFLLGGLGGGKGGHLFLAVASAVGALVFAIHPLRVESVAWATERRDVLSGFFYLLTLLLYLAYVRSRSSRQSRVYFAFSIVCMGLSLLSKAWGITLPAVLLVLDAYPCGRVPLRWKDRRSGWPILLEKLPFLALALLFAGLAFRAQFFNPVVSHSILERVAQAFYGVCFYPMKTLLPISLSPLYPLPEKMLIYRPPYVVCVIVVLAATGLLLRVRRGLPWALASWLLFGVIALPVLGLAQAGPQIAADRYSYLACLPFAALFALLWHWVMVRALAPPISLRWPLIALAFLGCLVCLLGPLTWRQSQVWRSSRTLWDHAVRLDAGNHIALENRGTSRQEIGDLKGAITDYTRALAIRPSYTSALRNRAAAWLQSGNARKAMADLDQAIAIDSEIAENYFRRAGVKKTSGDLTGAIRDYNRALELSPDMAKALTNRGNTWRLLGNLQRALLDLTSAIQMNPLDHISFNIRGTIRRDLGKWPEAHADFEQALRIQPGFVNARVNRGIVRERLGDDAGALADYRDALRMADEKWPHRGKVQRLLLELERKRVFSEKAFKE
jgi:tetratricopeptide (TPR) repeat protein